MWVGECEGVEFIPGGGIKVTSQASHESYLSAEHDLHV